MQKKLIFITCALIIGFFLLALADLIPFWMPMMGEMMVLMIATVLLLVWAGLIVTESATDERELLVTMQSGRLAYVAGLLTLVVALVIQGLAHVIDPWIAVSLTVMVGVKLIGRLYFDR